MKEEFAPVARYSAPSNILLFGEYAILTHGGLGIAVAVAPRVTATISPASAFSIVGLAAGTTVLVGVDTLRADSEQHDNPSLSPPARFLFLLFRFIMSDLCRGFRRMQHIIQEIPYCVTIDARLCYGKNGEKIGLGSSAASATCLTAACMWLMHAYRARRGSVPDPSLTVGDLAFQKRIFRYALRAHRAVRGGGSGYDIATSTFGGALRFRGGRRPTVKPYTPPWHDGQLRLLRGAQDVDSKMAIARHQQWKRNNRRRWYQYVRQSNRLIKCMQGVQTAQELVRLINISREMQVVLGDYIGVTAHFPLPTDGVRNAMAEYPRVAYRTVGAGNELAVVFGMPEAMRATATMPATDNGRLADKKTAGAPGDLLTVENDGIRKE